MDDAFPDDRGWWGPRGARAVLVGEAPSRRLDESRRWSAALVRKDLADLAGLSFPLGWVKTFGRVNLLSRWPGRRGKGSSFPIHEARARAEMLLPRLVRVPRVVLLGKRTMRAFCLDLSWFEWREELGTAFAVAPHPSRVSRWWNDPANVERARAFWTSLARSGGAGSRPPPVSSPSGSSN